MKRIAVIGTTGSGKTTLASQISERLKIRHVELDALHWEPDWTEAPREIFRERVECALTGDAWVIDGNYSMVRDIIWTRADTIVWIDYALPLILWRLIWRTLRRIATQEHLWNGNRESWRALFGRDSLLAWACATHPKHRRDYPILFLRPEYNHVAVIRLHSPRETDEWLASLSKDLDGF
ncbi:MAG: adenylate kinase [Chloroflexota bacterium]|nr:adenylate kinase [Chloroflexota bacterium]